jgi:hypothetical protein
MVNQSAIAGETMPVEKCADSVLDFSNQQLPELQKYLLPGFVSLRPLIFLGWLAF